MHWVQTSSQIGKTALVRSQLYGTITQSPSQVHRLLSALRDDEACDSVQTSSQTKETASDPITSSRQPSFNRSTKFADPFRRCEIASKPGGQSDGALLCSNKLCRLVQREDKTRRNQESNKRRILKDNKLSQACPITDFALTGEHTKPCSNRS